MPDSPTIAQPVIIIGAGRSGTNMLRDMLTQLPGVGTWSCDEINYIWRHHNARLPHDEFEPAHARSEVCRYIQRAFARQVRRQQLQFIVEKTCANSLRVGFVDAAVPNAKYLYLVRNGYDVAASAAKCWKAGLNLPYILKKARFVPLSDVPYYALRFLGHRLQRLGSRKRQLPTWGPRMKQMDELVAERPLEEVCALQWARCIERSEEAFAQLPLGRVHRLKYEELVTRPREQIRRVLKFLNIVAGDEQIEALTKRVSPRSVGKGRQTFTLESLEQLEPIVEPTLAELGYLSEPAIPQNIAA